MCGLQWRVVYAPRNAPIKNHDNPSSYQLPIAPWLRGECPPSLCLLELCLVWSFASLMYAVDLWEFMCAAALLCPENTVSLFSSPTYGSDILSAPFLQWSLPLGERLFWRYTTWGWVCYSCFLSEAQCFTMDREWQNCLSSSAIICKNKGRIKVS